MTKDHDNAQAERDRLVAIFGPDITIGLADEPTAQSRRPSTAQVHAKARTDALIAHSQADDVAVVAVAARELDEDEALDTALRIMRRGGGRTPPGTMRKAAKALKRRGYTQGSTAERLARMAGQGQGWRSA